jgi:4'-phosphopantetheinyl transferase
VSTARIDNGFFGVYKADCLGADTYRAFFDAASPERKSRALKMRQRKDACRMVVADSLVRHALELATGLEPSRMRFGSNDCGKPELHDSDVHFNISHSGEWVICVVDKKEIGVDVEGYRSVDGAIADRFFSEKEKKLIDECGKADSRSGVFFRIWTLKESYVKAIGKGLTCPLDSFSCLPYDGGRRIEFCSHINTLPTKKFRLILIRATPVRFADPRQ